MKQHQSWNVRLKLTPIPSDSLRFSPFNKPFKEEIDEWNDKLMYVSECAKAQDRTILLMNASYILK